MLLAAAATSESVFVGVKLLIVKGVAVFAEVEEVLEKSTFYGKE